MSALDVQVGGAHYKGRAIQPIEYISANNLNFCEGSIVKYITRWRDKGGVNDLEKIKHYVDLLIEMEGKFGELVQPVGTIAKGVGAVAQCVSEPSPHYQAAIGGRSVRDLQSFGGSGRIDRVLGEVPKEGCDPRLDRGEEGTG
jgi:hypothetical protein